MKYEACINLQLFLEFDHDSSDPNEPIPKMLAEKLFGQFIKYNEYDYKEEGKSFRMWLQRYASDQDEFFSLIPLKE
jgi:hypothetical protein